MRGKRIAYSLSELDITTAMIENFIGYGEGEAPGPVADLIAGVLAEVRDLCEPRAEYLIYEGLEKRKEKGEVRVGPIVFRTGNIILSQLNRAEGAAVFLCTAGRFIGELSRKHMTSGDTLKGYVYDVAGSVIVEAAADRMHSVLELEMSEMGTGVTNRFSPGYCGWDVMEQQKLFSLIPDNYCGITLNDSSLMEPVKSVSGIIGTGPGARNLPYSCGRCENRHCVYRGKRR